MGSSIGPVLTNIILTEFECVIVSELINDGVIKFYQCYVDDTLVLIKPSDIAAVLATLNSFVRKLKTKYENNSTPTSNANSQMMKTLRKFGSEYLISKTAARI